MSSAVRLCASLGALAFVLIGSRFALAGEQLQLDQLVARTEGAATVRVSLGSGKQPATVAVIKEHRNPGTAVVENSSWLGGCLPDRKTLHRWMRQFPKWRERRLWDRLSRQRSYEAFVFLKYRNGKVFPYCEVERMFLRHASIHPDYQRYVESALEKLKRATQAPSTIDPVPARLLQKMCAEGRCQGRGHSGSITVMRDKDRQVALLIYTAMGCSHMTINYHDRWGTFLVSQQTGPREPDEWNSPDDLKIRDLRQGLNEAERHSCKRIVGW